VTEGPRSVYVYGVLPASAGGELSVAGVTESPVRTVAQSGVAALVSDLEGDALTAAREVRAHWRVLEQATADATVLPVRFGTVMESDDAVRRQLLEPNADRLTRLMSELAGRVQVSVKGEYEQERLMRDVVRDAPDIVALRDQLQGLPEAAGYYERIRLGEMVAAEVERRREADRDLALERLEPAATEARVEELGSPDGAFNLAFLVERDRLDSFSAAVGKLAADLPDRLEIRYIGPLPPYSFAEADLSAGSEAWA
jgi:hypothetical protein